MMRSPWAPAANLTETRFRVPDLLHAVAFPFSWLTLQNSAMEPVFRDGRIAIGLLAAGGILACRLGRLRPRERDTGAFDRLTYLAAGWAVAYLVWLQLFSYYRYAIVLEALSLPLLIGLALHLRPRSRLAGAALFSIAVVLVSTTRAPDWGRRAWSDSYFGVDASRLSRFGDATVLMWDMPNGYVLPFFPPSATFVRLLSNRGLIPGTSMWNRVERRIARARPDRLFLLDLEPGLVHEQQAPVLERLGLAPTGDCERLDSYAGGFRVCRLRALPSSR
ncbi:MAG: hypothetical protein R2712_18955 [Vicinamibacterales bacterium]